MHHNQTLKALYYHECQCHQPVLRNVTLLFMGISFTYVFKKKQVVTSDFSNERLKMLVKVQASWLTELFFKRSHTDVYEDSFL